MKNATQRPQTGTSLVTAERIQQALARGECLHNQAIGNSINMLISHPIQKMSYLFLVARHGRKPGNL